jgi:hypothetical protein
MTRDLVLSRCQCVDYSIAPTGCKRRRTWTEKRFHFTVGAVPRMGNARSVENFLPDRLQELDAYEVCFAGFLLSLNPCLDRRHPGWHQARRDD